MSELEKMQKVIDSGETETLTNFYDWLNEQGYQICSRVKDGHTWSPRYAPVSINPNELFAQFFEIDLNEVEKERREILERIRNNS